jgi:hypothetical protein
MYVLCWMLMRQKNYLASNIQRNYRSLAVRLLSSAHLDVQLCLKVVPNEATLRDLIFLIAYLIKCDLLSRL